MSKPIKLSRTSVSLFLECSRCFYYKIVYKINRPNVARYSLNLEVDKLLKQEFDVYRSSQTQHPIQSQYKLPYYPAQNKNLPEWRHNFTGVQFQYENLLFYGSIDDLWVNPSTGGHTVVDYKATSSAYEPSRKRIDSYNTQLSFYSWLLAKNGLKMTNQNYILLYNAHTSNPNQRFDSTLRFKPNLITVPNNTSWIEPTIKSIQTCLSSASEPIASAECLYCQYQKKIDNQNRAVTLPF